MRPAAVGVLVTVTLGLPGTVAEAQQEGAGIHEPGTASEPDPTVLSLDDALRLATEFNPGYRQAMNQTDLTAAERRDAWLGLLPEPELRAFSTSMRWNRQAVETDFFGDPVEREEQGTVRTSTARQDVGLSFDVNPEDYLELREASRQGEVRELEAEETRSGLRADVVTAFLDAQERATAMELEEELLEMEETHLETAERLFQLAREERTELLAAELDVEEQRDRVDEARVDRDRALLSLRNLIGAPDLDDLELDPVEVEVFDPAGIDAEALLTAAHDGSPELRRGDRELEQVREDQRWGRWMPWIPSLSVNVRMGRNNIVRGGDAFFAPPSELGWDRDVDVMLSLPDPTNYLRSRNEQRRHDVELRNQEEVLRETRAQVEEDVRGGLMNLERDHQRVRHQERRVELAEERLTEALDSYRLGRISFLDLQAASEAAAEARRNALEARYEFQATRLELERNLGVPLDELLQGEVPPIGG